jgi:hypothetical protein
MECSLAAAHAYSVLLKEANLINNVWEPVGVGATTVLDKYSGNVIATIPEASETQLEAAILGSVAAFTSLRKWSAEEQWFAHVVKCYGCND